MLHARILELISRNQWAIAPSSLEAMIRIVQDSGHIADHALFHGSEDLDSELKTELEAANRSQKEQGYEFTHMVDSMGILQINGPIIQRGSMQPISGARMATTTGILRDLDALEEDSRVDRVAIVTDCPGGSVTGTSEVAARIQEMKKPVVVFAAGLCASAMYWIASACDAIIGSDTSLTGSVGVVAKVPIDSEGKFKTFVSTQSGLKNPDPETEEGAATYQKMVDETGDVFVNAVADYRGVTREEVLERFGQGTVMIASRAQANGMIDGVMTMREFLRQYSGDLDACSFLANSKSKKRRLSAANDKVDFSGQTVQLEREQTAVVNAVKNPSKGDKNMDLKQFLKENAEAQAEFTKALADAELKALEGFQAEMATVTKIVLSSESEYKKPVRVQAAKVLSGEMKKEIFDAALTMYEMSAESKNSKDAQDATDSIGDTGGLDGSTELSSDGKIRTQADFARATARKGVK